MPQRINICINLFFKCSIRKKSHRRKTQAMNGTSACKEPNEQFTRASYPKERRISASCLKYQPIVSDRPIPHFELSLPNNNMPILN
jgi:hypothetical protein